MDNSLKSNTISFLKAIVCTVIYETNTIPPAYSEFVLRNARMSLLSTPDLKGYYRASNQHPKVFLTPTDVRELAARTTVSASFTAQMFSALAARVKADLRANIDWNGVYSGCDLDIYLHLFSFEPMAGYAGQTRTETELEQAANVRTGTQAPKGATVAAARFALYASLVQAGAGISDDKATAARAIQVAKQILETWAEKGFPRSDGIVSANPGAFCARGQHTPDIEPTIGLQISRGMTYYVFAQDLLMGLKAFDATEQSRYSDFDTELYALLIQAHNLKFGDSTRWLKDCERYGNMNGSELTALIAIARILDDERKFRAVLHGHDAKYPVALNWTAYFNLAVYGYDDKPNACYNNTGPDARTSHPSFNTQIVVPGEIDDRFRNANPLQSIGYSMFTLTHLFHAAEILTRAGYDAYGYHGLRGQSLEASAEAFACYGRTTGFGKIVSDLSRNCPNFRQYDGVVVNGVEHIVVIGAFRYPTNAPLTSLYPEAERVEAPTVVDPLLFGIWPD